MEEKIAAFFELSKIFEQKGYHLYLVGGTVRDILLNLPLADMDVVTDANPDEMKFFVEGDYTFSRMGSVKCKVNDVRIDITTLRKEKHYKDYRHPATIRFVKDLKKDYVRRDFTINAMYMDKHFELIDYCHGLSDLNSRLIRMVGNPKKRIKEDPLRILRAIRFSLTYDFVIEPHLEKAMIQSIKLLDRLSKDKIKQEIRKINCLDNRKKEEFFSRYSIKYLLEL